ncbi:DUF1788 domain-containing protein [Mycolicibacterium sp. S3B2]|uniref:DUF1788 domain-containing protein n=1 Tax=Mycolicibacterium sp. S3B2 TaxID=3415120 RepID=UPI003C7A36AB
MTLTARFEHAYRVMTSPRFLNMEGLGNEVPYFILPYAPSDEPALADERRRLVNRLRTAGIAVCDIDLWALACTLWQETGQWEQLLEAEPGLTKDVFGEAVGNVISPGGYLSPAIARTVDDQDPPPQVVLLSNVGRLFPLVRSHTILNTLQPLLSNVPVVLVFPGSYRQSPTQGSSLVLFDRMTDDDYYRAFDLMDLEVS